MLVTSISVGGTRYAHTPRGQAATKHATVYWSLCLVTATALVGRRQLVGAAPPQANAPLDERVAAIVKSDILAAGVPSVSVAVMRDGKMLLERAWGVADIEKRQCLQVDDISRWIGHEAVHRGACAQSRSIAAASR